MRAVAVAVAAARLARISALEPDDGRRTPTTPAGGDNDQAGVRCAVIVTRSITTTSWSVTDGVAVENAASTTPMVATDSNDAATTDIVVSAGLSTENRRLMIGSFQWVRRQSGAVLQWNEL